MSWVMAALYDRVMQGMERACGDAWRRELLADLRGDVLEIGAGTGRNLDHYRNVTKLVLTEPDEHMRRKLRAATKNVTAPARETVIEQWGAEQLGCASGSFDAVVSTLVLCSVGDPRRCVEEIRRVLRPGGKLVFLEHVAAEGGSRLAWQRRVEPLWKVVAGNCHLCRNTARTIEEAGFGFERLTRESARKALPLVRPMIRGVATRPAS